MPDNGIALPGDLELHTMCANARRLASFCEMIKVPRPGLADYDPDPPYESLDMAFVITTPETATIALLGLGSLALLRRKHKV